MHRPGYVQGGQEANRGYLLLGIYHRRIPGDTGMDPDPDPSMRLLQKSEYTTLSRPQQHSHSREKVLVNSLLQAN